jgi:hypothetical protein
MLGTSPTWQINQQKPPALLFDAPETEGWLPFFTLIAYNPNIERIICCSNPLISGRVTWPIWTEVK